jgi:predicted transcriptional regulator
MIARDVMTRDVVSVTSDTAVRKIASLLLENHISAMPVIDGTGAPIGFVSEGNLVGRKEAECEVRED